MIFSVLFAVSDDMPNLARSKNTLRRGALSFRCPRGTDEEPRWLQTLDFKLVLESLASKGAAQSGHYDVKWLS